MALMTLGLFVFETNSAPFSSMQRSTAFTWASNQRFGRAAAHQFTGRGDDTRTLSGVLYPELTGGPVNLDILREMANSGKAYILMSGEGDVQGAWFIENVNETRSYFLAEGAAQKIEFTVNLKRYDDNNVNELADLSQYVKGVVDTSIPPQAF